MLIAQKPPKTSAAPSPAFEHTLLAPATLVCFDIETCHAEQAVIDAEIERYKAPPSIKDPEKIKAKKEEFKIKITDKSALLDASHIACISARTQKVGMIFNGVNKKTYPVNHSQMIASGNEKQMLIDFRDWLDSTTTPETVLIGFNIYNFDLPRLRAAYMRNRLKLPNILTPRLLDDQRQPTIDVMKMFLRGFTADCAGDLMISLKEVVLRLGLPSYKNRIDGAQVPDFIRQGKIKEVLSYCAVDTMATLAAYQLMTSVSSDMV